MIAREEHAVALVHEDGVVVGVSRRPLEARGAAAEVDRVAVVHPCDVVQVFDALAHRDPGLTHALVDVARHAVAHEPDVGRIDRLVSLRPHSTRCGDLWRVHQDLGAGALERSRHAHVIRMEMGDEDALQVRDPDPRFRESRAEGLFGLGGVESSVDETPPMRALHQIRVHDGQAADREGDGDAPDARRDKTAQRK